MTHTISLVAFAPLVQLPMLVAAAYGARWLSKRLPEGRLKRVLYYKI